MVNRLPNISDKHKMCRKHWKNRDITSKMNSFLKGLLSGILIS